MATYLVGEQGFNLNVVVKDKDGNVVNITGKTVTFYMFDRDGSSSKINGGACVIDDGAAGKCHYVVQAGDFDEAKVYRWEIKLVDGAEVRKARGTDEITIMTCAP